jgi:hypothetical protein
MMGSGGRILEDLRLPFERPRNPAELPFTDEFRRHEQRLRRLLAHNGA